MAEELDVLVYKSRGTEQEAKQITCTIIVFRKRLGLGACAQHQCSTTLSVQVFSLFSQAYCGGIMLSNSISRNHSLASPHRSKIALL